ncbi:preprotein translocase subunit SecE [Gammaproteobacteria bacterium LSUCC0057]|uniref:Protein translocase subunit SecE n=1 Tax=Gammaproteobacteria bacterium LSUCC0057 TaxID=2559237 RepID=A0A4Y8UFJ2_9GAMM|nr:preprotein translocase subunit SecE [Gammaproteobacteria bacterium LSUCC0057]
MSSAVDNKEFRFDSIKWLLVLAIVAGGIYGNWYFAEQSVLYRAIALLVLALLAASVASQTSKGQATLELARGARTEWRKIVWPTKQERNQTTLIVVVLIIVMALILWGIDTLLSLAAAGIMG